MKAMKKIDNFCGDEGVERWLDRFELAISIDGLEDKEARLLSMYLSGASYDTWKNLSCDEKDDPKGIKDALRNAFGLRRSEAWRSVLSTRAIAGESLDVVGERIRKLVREASAGTDPLSYISGLILLDSLPRAVRDQVVLHVGEELIYENVLSASKKIWPSRPDLNACVGGLRSNQDSPRASLQPPTFQRRPLRCYGCNRMGHTQKDCTVVCHGCSQIGHVSSKCNAPAVHLNKVEGTTRQSVVPNLNPNPEFSQNKSSTDVTQPLQP